MLTEILEIKNIKSVENITNKTHPREDRLFKFEEKVQKLKQRYLADSKETVSFKHSRIDAHVNSETVTAHERPAHAEARQSSTLRRGIGHSIPPLTKKLLVIDTDWQMEYKYSPVECHWVISMTLQDPMCSSWPTQNRLNCTFVNFFFHLFRYF